jgi:hypothetical protein
MWQVLWNLFRSNGLSPEFDDRPRRCSSATDYGLAAQNLVVGNNVNDLQ